MNSEELVRPAKMQPHEIFNPEQRAIVTGGQDGKLFRIAYTREVPLLLKAPPYFFVFATYRKEMRSVLALQTADVPNKNEMYSDSYYIGVRGSMHVFIFIQVLKGKLYVWHIGTKSALNIVKNASTRMFEKIPYGVLNKSAITLPESFSKNLLPVKSSMKEAQNLGIMFKGKMRRMDVVCFVLSVLSYIPEMSNIPIPTLGESVFWDSYAMSFYDVGIIKGFQGIGLVVSGNEFYSIVAINGATTIVRGIKEQNKQSVLRNLLSNSGKDSAVEDMCKSLMGLQPITLVINETNMTMSYAGFLDVCDHLMQLLSNLK